jgi:hypothetical protein
MAKQSKPVFTNHIFRITNSEISAVVLSTKESPTDGFENEIIASFKTADLRDLAFAAYRVELKLNSRAYPNHKIKG